MQPMDLETKTLIKQSRNRRNAVRLGLARAEARHSEEFALNQKSSPDVLDTAHIKTESRAGKIHPVHARSSETRLRISS